MRTLRHLIAGMIALPATVLAGQAGDDTGHFFDDLEAYTSAPLRWDGRDWLTLGAITGGLAIISETVDDSWKQEMISEHHPAYYDTISRIGDNWGGLQLSGPFMLGVYGYGLWNHDQEYLNAGYNMFQAGAYTGLATLVLKRALHRDRPNAALDEAGWFKDGRSFPSGHTSLAFSVSRAYLNSLGDPSLPTQVLFYGLATSTALARTKDNKHWASDVVAGALLGIYTADFVQDRDDGRREDIAYFPYADMNTVGVRIVWR